VQVVLAVSENYDGIVMNREVIDGSKEECSKNGELIVRVIFEF